MAEPLAGRIVYRRGGVEYGREWFSQAGEDGGETTVHATCVFDDVGIRREVVWTADAARRPVEAHVRLLRDGAWVGSGTYRTTGDGVAADLWGPGRPVAHESAAVTGPWALVTHPVALDGWSAGLGADDGGGLRRYTCVNTSTRPDGGDGPLLRTHPLAQRTVADDVEVRVGAGTFRCTHVQIVPHAAGMAPFDLFVEPRLRVLTRLDWPGYGDYELMALERRATSSTTSPSGPR